MLTTQAYLRNPTYIANYGDILQVLPNAKLTPVNGKHPILYYWPLRPSRKYNVPATCGVGVVCDRYIKIDVDCADQLLNTLLYRLHCQLLNTPYPMTVKSKKGLSVIVQIDIPGSSCHTATARQLKLDHNAQVEIVGSYRQQFVVGSKNHSLIVGEIKTVSMAQLQKIIEISQQYICDYYNVDNKFTIKVKTPKPLSPKWIMPSEEDFLNYVEKSVGNYIVKRRSVGDEKVLEKSKHIANIDRITAGLLRTCRDYYPHLTDRIVDTIHSKLTSYYKGYDASIPINE